MSYDKYIILASNSKVLSGDYTGFVNFREVVEVAENISTKQKKIQGLAYLVIGLHDIAMMNVLMRLNLIPKLQKNMDYH